MTFANKISAFEQEEDVSGVSARYYQRLGESLVKLVKTPTQRKHEMQMNHYNINEILCLLSDNDVVEHFFVQHDHGGHLAVEMFFRKAG
jgi:hypothetical protein